MSTVQEIVRALQSMSYRVRKLETHPSLGSAHVAISIDTGADDILSLSEQEIGLCVQSSARVLAGPVSGVAAIPTFRALALTDMPLSLGWQILTDCTYISATSFSLVGDWSGYLVIGTKFKCTNGGSTKYGYVLSSTYSSGTGLTTVNLISNTSYSLASGAITSAYFSYVDAPDFPGWFTYTPSWTVGSGTAPSIGSGTLLGTFALAGRIAKVSAELIFASDTNPETGYWYLSLPVTGGSNCGLCIGIWRGNNVGSANYDGAVDFVGTTRVRFNHNASNYINYNNPFAWGDTDSLRFSISYPI